MPDSEPNWSRVLARLSDSGIQIALVVTGGGAGALGKCFTRPGASTNFVEATVPYSRGAATAYLAGKPIGSSASPDRAAQLATTALNRAESHTDRDAPIEAAGIALVAALPTTIPRKDKDRAHLSVRTRGAMTHWSLDLGQGTLDRETAESLCEQLILVGLAELIGEKGEETGLRSRCSELGVSLQRMNDA